VRRAAEVVAQSVVLLGEPPSGAGAEAPDHGLRPVAMDEGRARAPQSASGVPELDDLLPHRPPMRFVEGIESETDDGVVCAVRVPERSAFNAGGSAPALVALEMAAQTAAVCEALRRFRATGDAGCRSVRRSSRRCGFRGSPCHSAPTPSMSRGRARSWRREP
jgi:hypothetical protein